MMLLNILTDSVQQQIEEYSRHNRNVVLISMMMSGSVYLFQSVTPTPPPTYQSSNIQLLFVVFCAH